MSLIFLDTETTGLDPYRHEIWEIAYAIDDGPIEQSFVCHSGINANPDALLINGYFDRYSTCGQPDTRAWMKWEGHLRNAVEGATIVGANPAFDAAFLRARWGVSPWHHRLWDVGAYASGVLGLDKVLGLAGIASRLTEMGYDIPDPDHTAAADVATLRACFDALRSHRAGDAA